MSGERENHEKQSDSMEQDDPAKTVIEERIRKKEKQLQQISSRIALLQKEKELDEKIRQANKLVRLYTNDARDGQISDAIDQRERGNRANLLTTGTMASVLYATKLDENEEKLYRFAMRTIAEENMEGGLYDTVVMLYFSRGKTVKVSKGTETQRMIIFFDEDNNPAFRWEIKNSDLKK